MKFNKVSKNTTLRVQDIGSEVFEGVYIGPVNGQFGPNYKFFSQDKIFLIYATKALTQAMSQIEPSYAVRIAYLGPKNLDDGHVYHDIDVEVSDEPVNGFDLTPYLEDVEVTLEDLE